MAFNRLAAALLVFVASVARADDLALKNAAAAADRLREIESRVAGPFNVRSSMDRDAWAGVEELLVRNDLAGANMEVIDEAGKAIARAEVGISYDKAGSPILRVADAMQKLSTTVEKIERDEAATGRPKAARVIFSIALKPGAATPPGWIPHDLLEVEDANRIELGAVTTGGIAMNVIILHRTNINL